MEFLFFAETTSPLNNESSNLDDESEVVINSSSGYDVKLLAVSRQQKHQATSPNIPQSPEINHSVTPPIVEVNKRSKFVPWCMFSVGYFGVNLNG